MMVVAGQSELRVHIRRLRQRPPSGGAFGNFGAATGSHIAAVHLVTERRHQQHYIRLWLARSNDERDEVLAGVVADMCCIESAGPIIRNLQAGTLGPAQRTLVVVVEMDRAILDRK